MRHMYAFLALLAFPFHVYGQVLTYKSALELYKTNSPEVIYLQQELKKSLAETDEYARISNPEISYEREEIENETEQFLGLSKKINLLGQSFIKMGVANTEEDALQLQYEYELEKLTVSFSVEYLEVLKMKDEMLLNKEVFATVSDAYNAANERYREGNISGFEVKRFQVQLDTYQKGYNDSRNNYLNAMGILLAKIYPGDELQKVLQKEISSEYLGNIAFTDEYHQDLASMQQTAQGNRKDLKAYYLFRESSSSKVAIEKLNRLPELGISGGYKKVSGVGDGFVVGLSLDLPLFNMNGNHVEIAEAGESIANVRYQQKKKEVILEVTDIYNRLKTTGQQFVELKINKDKSTILETAIELYNEGKISLIELIDAAEAYKTYQIVFNDIKYEYQMLVKKSELILGKINTGI